MAEKAKGEPITAPFTVLIDQQEKIPYRFEGLKSDARQGRRPLIVPTKVVHLKTGDYQIEGLPGVAVERKGGADNGAADLFGTLGQHRDRFERELARLADMDFAAVVVEASWHDILFDPPEHSELLPKTVMRSILAWMQRMPRVHWVMAGSRGLGEVMTFRILERCWNDRSH